MIRLGNIDFSNCYPIHAPLLAGAAPDWVRVVDGPPSELNRRLAAGELDVAPGSSIELARHSREYSALGGLCIGSDGPVDSIILVSRHPLGELDGRTVALPTVSATSRCLARILLETRLGILPRWVDFDQSRGTPLGRTDGASEHDDTGIRDPAAALFIGDTALRRTTRPGERRYDLGSEWTNWTGLPFVFALWMVRDEAATSPEIRALHRMLIDQRDTLPATYPELAVPASRRFGMATERLCRYWSHITYSLDDRMLAGYRRFLNLAAELGDAPRDPRIRLL
jgi:chorismate dehydratase